MSDSEKKKEREIHTNLRKVFCFNKKCLMLKHRRSGKSVQIKKKPLTVKKMSDNEKKKEREI